MSLSQPSHVSATTASENGIAHRVFSARKYGSHSRSNGAFANLQFSLAGNKSGVPDGDAGNIGDGIERPRCAIKGHAKIACAWFGGPAFLSRRNRNCRESAKKQR